MKKTIQLLLALALVLSLAVPVLADEQEMDLTYLEVTKDVVFWVTWDVEMPQIIFIAPDGTEFDPMQTVENTETIYSETEMYYVVLGAQAGQWRVRYDKLTNTNVEVVVMDYSIGLRIESFTQEEISGDQMPVAFTVAGKEGCYYNYRISAVVDHSGAEILLSTGGAYTADVVNEIVNLNGLSSHSGYMLKLYVWYVEGEADIFDFAFSEPFDYSNSSVDGVNTGFGVTVLPDQQILYVTWENLSYRVDEVTIAIYDNDQSEPTSFSTYPADKKQVQLAYDPASTQITIAFAVRVDGIYSMPDKKTIVLSDFVFDAPEGKSHNSLVWPVQYRDLVNQEVTLEVNGETSNVLLDGSGSLNVMLHDDWNTVKVHYTTAEQITWQIEREIYVDRTPPVLTMNADYDGMGVAGTAITLSGTVINCDILTVNGAEVTVNDDGTFSCSVNLKAGANAVQIVARDSLGNSSVYNASIFSGPAAAEPEEGAQTMPGSLVETLVNGYWMLLLVSVLGVIVIVYALVFWRKGERK